MVQSLSNTEKQVAIIDLGSASVGGAVVGLQADGQPTVRFAIRREVPIKDRDLKEGVKDPVPYLTAIEKVSEQLVTEAQAADQFWWAGFKKPFSEVLCVVASPWYVSQVSTLTAEQAEPIELTRSVARSLLDKEFRRFISREGTKPAAEAPVVMLDQDLVEARLNGYPVDRPIGHLAEHIELSVYQAGLPARFSGQLQAALRMGLGTDQITTRSAGGVGFRALRKLSPDVANFIYLDVTGRSTELLTVQEHKPTGANHFELGSENCLDSLAEEFKVPTSIATSYLKAYTQRQLETEFHRTLTTAWRRVATDWLERFQARLEELPPVNRPTVFLAVQSQYFALFKQLLTDERLSDFNKITLLDQVRLLEGCRWPGQNYFDPFLALNAIYAQLQFEASLEPI